MLIPTSQDTMALRITANLIPRKGGFSMATILVCDDDKQIVEAIDIYLTGEGFHVIKA